MGAKDVAVIKPFVTRATRLFRPCRVILFGSRAKGVARKDSDYDVLLISPAFKRIEFSERMARAYRLKRDIPAAMDILCLTPQEARKRSKYSVVAEALREGKDITAMAQ